MSTRVTSLFGRVFADLLLFVGAVLLPSHLVLLAGGVLFFWYDGFIELILVALFMDLLYGDELLRFGGFQFVLSIFSLCAYVLLAFAKKWMRLRALQ